MHRLIWMPALALAACGTETDQRPRTVEYITEAVLAPNCGNAQCHSSFRNVSGYAFDTVQRAQQSLVGLAGFVDLDDKKEPVVDISTSLLLTVLTRTVKQMPYDQPLAEPDIDLIARWIDYGAPGAQCDPSINGGKLCIGNRAVECGVDFNFASITDCTSCSAGVCR